MSNSISRNTRAFFLLFPLLLFSCSSGGGGGGCDVPEGGGTGWTFLVYMAGDNDLSDAALADLDEMAEVGSKGRVRIVVQRDLVDEGTVRLVVGKACTKIIEDMGEVNMASPETLQAFIEWGTGRYPADFTALILWSHGDGHAKPGSGVYPISSGPLPYGILQDDTDGVNCCLSNQSVRQAIEDSGAYFHLLGFDASMMGQIETAYEFVNVADLLVFSQESGQTNGWDYAPIIQALADNPVMPARQLAGTIVEAYRNFYENVFYPSNPGFPQVLTISAIDLGIPLEETVSNVDLLADYLLASLDQSASVDAVKAAREATQNLNSILICNLYADLFDWVEIMGSHPELGEDVLSAISNLEAIKDEVIISNYHGASRPEAQGLSIVFHAAPDPSCSNFSADYLDGTSGHAFVEDTSWDEFLSQYFEAAGLL